MLTKEEIFELPDLTPVPVEVPEWDGEVCVRPLTLAERFEFEEVGKEGRADFVISLIVKTVCDESGKPLFTVDDIAALRAKNGVALSRIFRAATKVNGLTAADVKELEKNSEAAQDEDSLSD